MKPVRGENTAKQSEGRAGIKTGGEKLVVFDLDGTLNRTELFALPAHRQVTEEFGGNRLEPEQIIALFGENFLRCQDVFLPEATRAEYLRYLARLEELEMRYAKTLHGSFDGTGELLAKLWKEGYILAICSNTPLVYIDTVLHVLGIEKYFSARQGTVEKSTKAETLRLLLGKIPHQAAVMVGDTAYDMEAARANGLGFIGCLYGYRPEGVAQADRTVKRPADIYRAVKALTG
jgi:phosphoglycolate phosphatase